MHFFANIFVRTTVLTDLLDTSCQFSVLLAQWLTWLTRTVVVVTQRCRVQSPLAARTFLEQESLITYIALCRGGAHKSTGPLCVCSELKIRQVKDPTCSQGCSVAKFAM